MIADCGFSPGSGAKFCCAAANLYPESFVSRFRMKRKAFMIGFVALGITLGVALPPSSGRIQNFQAYFQDLKAGSSLNPVERFVFSLVLANTDVAQNPK